MASRGIQVLILTVSVIAGLQDSVCADLSTASASSIEWKVSTSNAIYLARIVADASRQSGATIEPLSELTHSKTLDQFPNDLDRFLCVSSFIAPKHVDSEWLLFARGSGNDTRIFAAVNLSNPLLTWDTAAITCKIDGNAAVLTYRDEILTHVHSLIQNRAPQPLEFDPDFAEEILFKPDFAPRIAWLSVKVVGVHIDLWDQVSNPGMDQDTLVNRLLEPIDARTFNNATLETFESVADRDANIPLLSMWSKVEHPLTEESQKYVGTWTGDMENGTATVQFFSNGTLFYVLERKPREDNPKTRAGVFGAAFWYLRGGSLRIACDDATGFIEPRSVLNRNKTHWGLGTLTTYLRGGALRPIHPAATGVQPESSHEIITPNGVILSRVDKQLRIVDYPCFHPLLILHQAGDTSGLQ